MSITISRSAARAALAAAATLSLSPAFAHAVCGDRIFPATLSIDDPGVGDELALPTLTYLPQNGDGAEEFDAEFSWTKTILPGLGLSFSDGATWQRPGGYGWESLDTELKYNILCVPDHEFMASLGADIVWGRLGTGSAYTPFNAYSPVLDIGKGFGDLPASLNILRPLAITAEVSASVPGQAWSDGSPNATTLNYGFTVQYSLPYYNSHVAQIDNAFFRRLIPLTEVNFSTPISNYGPGPQVTTGSVQPGVIYMADTWQFALEAVAPINSASGHRVGVVGELHFFFDDIFPDSLGKPIFTGTSGGQ
jgi:hypothetical protein